MRLFIFFALFLLPITLVQFYSAESFALTGETVQQKTLFNKTLLPSNLPETLSEKPSVTYKSNKKTFVVKRHNFIDRQTRQIQNMQISNKHEFSSHSSSNTKKVKVIKGKRNSEGMRFLSVLLMIKDNRK